VPIKSYLAHAIAGRRDELAQHLGALASCAVLPATNHDVVVLVTDTPDEAAEEALGRALARAPGLQCLTLVAGLAYTESPECPPPGGDDDPS
jgi:NAD(P)-dependent dehydrogenase (short-subunit alcohol dehydrogenase family)